MTGSVRPVVAWVSFVLALLCVVLAVVTARANGLLVLALIFAGVHGWAVGAHTKDFWSR